MTILVTGANGQLGQTIKSVAGNYKALDFVFTSKSNLDITDSEAVTRIFNKKKLDYCINCAAYTNVDSAETDKQLAYEINTRAVKHLANTCRAFNVVLIHISTDFVFDGHSTRPYLEHDTPNPINYYGVTKYQAELEIKNALKRYFIIRTSWLYSEYGRNFLKTMLRLGDEKKELPIVNDQIGTPTYAGDLAQVIVKIINSDSNAYGIYHYSNKGQCSWFDFAKEIFAYTKNDIKINPIATHRYKRPAQRPGYSVLNKRKIEKGLDVKIPSWRKSLSLCINTKINET